MTNPSLNAHAFGPHRRCPGFPSNWKISVMRGFAHLSCIDLIKMHVGVAAVSNQFLAFSFQAEKTLPDANVSFGNRKPARKPDLNDEQMSNKVRVEHQPGIETKNRTRRFVDSLFVAMNGPAKDGNFYWRYLRQWRLQFKDHVGTLGKFVMRIFTLYEYFLEPGHANSVVFMRLTTQRHEWKLFNRWFPGSHVGQVSFSKRWLLWNVQIDILIIQGNYLWWCFIHKESPKHGRIFEFRIFGNGITSTSTIFVYLWFYVIWNLQGKNLLLVALDLLTVAIVGYTPENPCVGSIHSPPNLPTFTVSVVQVDWCHRCGS